MTFKEEEGQILEMQTASKKWHITAIFPVNGRIGPTGRCVLWVFAVHPPLPLLRSVKSLEKSRSADQFLILPRSVLARCLTPTSHSRNTFLSLALGKCPSRRALEALLRLCFSRSDQGPIRSETGVKGGKERACVPSRQASRAELPECHARSAVSRTRPFTPAKAGRPPNVGGHLRGREALPSSAVEAVEVMSPSEPREPGGQESF
jgi:hypothetical protein